MFLCKHVITEDMFLTSKKEFAEKWNDQGERFIYMEMGVTDKEKDIDDLIENVNNKYEKYRG